MCRSIKTLRGAKPLASDAEIRAAALQFVRKISGYRAPSRGNTAAFDRAVDDVTRATENLLSALVPARASRLPESRGNNASAPGPRNSEYEC